MQRNERNFKMYKFIVFVLFICVSNADIVTKGGATLKPLSICCDIPEISDPEPLANCSNPRLNGPCNEIQCIFEKSGFLTDKETLNKEAYTNHLIKWAQNNKGWSVAVDKVISDCVDADLRQHLHYPCKAYDVFACTGIAMLKKCPNDAWKC